MQNIHQYLETNEQIIEDANILLLENTVSEKLVLISQDAHTKENDGLDNGDDYSKINNPKEDMENDEDNQSDTIRIDENYPGPKESDIDQVEQPGIKDGNQEE